MAEGEEKVAVAHSDQDKLKKIWSELGEDLTPYTHHGLCCEQTEGRKRVVLVTLKPKAAR